MFCLVAIPEVDCNSAFEMVTMWREIDLWWWQFEMKKTVQIYEDFNILKEYFNSNDTVNYWYPIATINCLI